jgi:hypothetical protein
LPGPSRSKEAKMGSEIPEASVVNRSAEQTRRALLGKAGIGAATGLGVAALARPDEALASTITGWINVKDPPYNAGTGAADDGPQINNAINDAVTQGALVYFPPGTYNIGTTLLVKDNTHLKGSGQLKSKLGATSSLSGTRSVIENIGMGTGQPNSDIIIEDLEIDGNKSARTGATGHLIAMRGSFTNGAPSRRIHLLRLYGHDSTSLGFTLQSCSDSEIVGCEVANCDRDGADFWWNSQGCRIAYNYIHDCGDDHIALNGEDVTTDAGYTLTDIAVVGNVVRGGSNLGNGIRIAGAKRVTITGNVVFQPWFAGIAISSANSNAVEDISITGNVIKDAGKNHPTTGYGLYLSHLDFPLSQADITRVTISDNVIIAPKTLCIGFRGLKTGAKIAQVSIANNILESPGVHGISIENLGTGTEVSDVAIDGNTLIGISDGGFGIICNGPAIPVKRLSITNNRVRDWFFTGISVMGPNQFNHSVVGNTSIDNGIRGNSGNGIDLKSIDGLTVVGNRCRGNKTAGLNLQDTVTETLVTGNDLSANSIWGINLTNTTGQTLVTGNMVAGNTGPAIGRTNLNATTFIFENAGDDPPVARHLYGVLTAYNPPSIPNGATASQTLTITGAALGDTVSIASTHMLPNGMFFVANVTAANTVTIQLANLSGATQDVGAGDVKVDVWKH